MVPVRLELQNFLSYGTEAPTLNFDTFDVACLSGGNGEGKSALLDAMTWAIWGEARKSSGKRKPDDELIRIGTRHMEVTFTFDLEDTRYRVTRSFSRSSTGKTTSSDLEFQVHAPEADAYRPLTGSTQRETQARIDDAVGLDYDTFINSAFLLQGRSDEFTQKSPSQRKEILVRILNLSRYEQLEDRARERWRTAKERQKRAEAEVERLQKAISDAPSWRSERDALQSALDRQEEILKEYRAEEKDLAQRRADLKAKVREAESTRDTIASLEDRIEKLQDEIAALEDRIEEADALLDQSDEIRAAHKQYEALQEERDALDEQRDLHRRLEKQIEQKKAALRDKINEVERRLDRLQVERQSAKEALRDCEDRLSAGPSVAARLREAQAARQRVSELAARRSRRQALQQQQEAAGRLIVGRRQELRAELGSIEERIEEERDALKNTDALKGKIERLEAKMQRRDKLDKKLDALEEKGKEASRRVQAQAAQLEARREEREQEVAELERFRKAEGETCPTCGSELTEAHRREVEKTLQAQIEELNAAIETRQNALQEETARRDELRERYSSLQEERQALDGVGEALATAREQRRRLEETAESLEAHTEQAEALRRRLDAGRYAAEARRTWQYCAQRLAELFLDQAMYDDLQDRAAQFDRYVDRLRELEETAERKDELERKVEEHDEKIQSLRKQLNDGSAVESLRQEIDHLEEKLNATDFDPDRFQKVREQLRELSDAPGHLSELEQAKSRRDEWAEKRDRLQQRLDNLRQDRTRAQDQLATLKEALDGKDALEARIEEVSRAVAQAEDERNDLQQRLGKIEERLDQAERDREALEAAKDERADATRKRRLYKHLRTAFGKHGIPSLIIEETLPEIEKRANRILDRLTDGRMHVRLNTLKEKKSGGTKETLEIILTDEQGVPRPYETFSGGESFRVNFALRVALAQLLAERSGVRVRTLVIDEGFGTQDEEGIERLVEAIQTIREDFAKVLVITHLERLKQAFPVRIEVEKDAATGSTFEIVRG